MPKIKGKALSYIKKSVRKWVWVVISKCIMTLMSMVKDSNNEKRNFLQTEKQIYGEMNSSYSQNRSGLPDCWNKNSV